jgi:hypothetical protein
MAENRKPREIQTRQQDVRPMTWRPPELLPEPDPMPGFDTRWVRVALNNNADPRNLSSKLREGYEPVSIEEQPKYAMLADPNSRFSNSIEIGGLLLCKIPSEYVKARADYEANLTNQQAEAVDNSFMRQSDTRMPLFAERKSTVSFGVRS